MDCKTIRGLILDASELTAGLIVSELKAHGCELDLLHACTMHEFEKSIRTSLPDIIFCNHLPPVIDAVTAFKLKRDICPGTPFFCISESFDDETVTELLRQGASDCIVRANHTWIEILAIKALREIENSQEHRKYDQRMYESQEKYSILFDTMPVGVIYQDATGEIISANPASEKILGISLDQMKGKTSMDPRWKMITEEGLDVPGSEHPVMIALRTGQKVGPVTRGVFIPEKNEYVWLSITAIPLFKPGEKKPYLSYATIEDVSLIKRNETMLQEQQHLLETVINHLPAAVSVLTGDDFRIELANPSYRAFAPGKEMIGLTWDELWPETGQDFKRICKQVLDTGEPFSVIDQHNTIRRSPEGPLEDAYFSWSLNRIKLPGDKGWGLMGTSWETTQRKTAEKELEKTNHRLKKVLEAENVGVVFWNTEKGLLMDANDAFLKMMGYDRDDIEKQEFTWQKFTPQEYHDISLEEMEKFRTIGRVGPYEKEYYCKDGSRKWLFFAGSSLGGNECVEFCIDISDRKRLEKELEEKQVLIHEMGKAAKVGGWDFDVETGKGTWTEETARIHDMDPSVETNVDLGVSFFKPNSKQKIEEAIHKIIETGVPYNLELELVSAKGVEKWVQTIGSPVFENGKVLKVRGSIQDITARKLTEIAIAESEARYRSLFENMNAGFVLFEAVTNKQGVAVDLKILAANSGFEKTTGLNLSNAIGQHLTKVLPGIEKDEADWIGRYSQVALTGQSAHFEQGSELLGFYYSISAFQSAPGQCAVTFLNITERKKAESELMRMSRIMKNSQEIAHLGSFEFVAADQTTIWSEEEYRIYGLDPAGPSPTYEVMLEKCIHPEDRDLLHDTFMQAFQNKGVYELEHRITRPNGEVRWVVDKAHPYFDENGKLLRYVGATLDITERKLAEMELRRSEEKFRGLFQNHTAVKLIIDPDTGDIAEANQAAASFFGWPVEVLKSMNVRQINTSPVETLKEEISKAVHNGKSKFQFRHKKADGSVVDVEIFTSVISIEGKQYLHSIIQDISEKKKTENQLKLLNRAIEASSVAVIITNAEGEISYVNPFFSQMTGYGHNEIMGQKPSILKSGFLSATLYKELWSAISTGNTWEGELLNKKKNGDLFWVRILISPITNSKGELTNFVAIQEDISFKKQAAEIQNQLEVAQKSARFKQDFLAKMSHEIRTPLTGVLGMIEVLGQTPLAADQQEYIADIKTSGENLKEIINQVLEYSKIEAGKVSLRPQDFEFKTLFQETKQLYKDNLQAGVEFNIEIDPNIPSFIHADKFRLSQIVHNLVSNAIKFTHHGSVTLKAGLVPSTAGDKPQVMKIEVSDTGKGIPESLQSLLFSPFVQSEEGEQNLYEGTGLGLSICKELVQLMNGEVGVVSKEEQGSTFWFTFAFEATPEVLVAEKKSCPLGESRSLHILVTEDTLVLQKVTKLLLMSMGHQVQLANHGQHALEMFEPGKFDLILMDVNMPIMDGVTATRLLKEQYANLPPIVGLSANAFEGDREKYITTGMDDYMIKPFNKEEFERVVARLLPLVKE